MAISSEIKVIVVGAGYGGMAAAIELTKKGCNVTVFESTENLTSAGMLDVGSLCYEIRDYH